MVIFDFFQSLIFNIRVKRAIKQARESASLHNRKYLVMVNNGRPVCVSMQGVRRLIAQKRFTSGFTAEKARQIAIFEAMPPKTSPICS